MSILESTLTREKVLKENKRVHKLEDQLYLDRHPEQTNFFQNLIVEKTLDQICCDLDANAKVLDLGCGTGYLFLRFSIKARICSMRFAGLVSF